MIRIVEEYDGRLPSYLVLRHNGLHESIEGTFDTYEEAEAFLTSLINKDKAQN